MPDPFWVSLPQAVENWATALGIIVGGGWAYYRFGLRREKETALAIDLAHTCTTYETGKYLVFFDVTLTNKGSVRVTAKRKQLPAYSDSSETLNYGGDLLVRQIPSGASAGTQVRWFREPSAKSPLPGDIEADLLDEYLDNCETDFWMEPGESYHVSAAMVLNPGSYLAMVTFVGQASDEEFWRRVFLVQVPTLSPTGTIPNTSAAA
jgi:hypothetical protein